MAFAFGLLHGFGFAGALVELGLPQGDIPLALLAFNVGVELGQLAFIAVIAGAIYAVRQVVADARGRPIVASAYAIGTVAAFWSIERLDAMFLKNFEREKQVSKDERSAERRKVRRFFVRIGLPDHSIACRRCLASLGAGSATTDIGTSTRQRPRRLFPSSGPIRPGPGAISRRVRSSATRTLHTGFSMDAGAFGARLAPADAYRFAKGEEITASSGQPAKLSRPLDFLVVTDHSDNMGFFPDLLAGKPELLADPMGRKWYDMIQSGQGAAAAVEIITAFGAGKFKGPLLYSPDSAAYRSAWQDNHQGGGRGERSRPLHRLHRLRMDLEHRRQQSAPQRHLPRRWRQGEPGRALTRRCRRAATIRAICGNGWRPMRTRPAATCSPSPITATCPTASCSR